MGYRQFYRFVFSLFLSLNILVYFAKSGQTLLYSAAAALITFGLSYLLAMIVFRRIGWNKQGFD